MKNRKQFREQVTKIRRAIIEAIPIGVSFSAIIIALAEVIVFYQEQAMDED